MNPIRVALVLLLMQSAQTKQNLVGVASVEGVVVDRMTGAALSGVSVELTGIVGTNVEARTTTTDKTGKFLLKNIPSGIPYWLIAAPTSHDRKYMSAVHGQRGLTGPGSQITLQSNQQMKDVRLALIPTGSISGRILNEKGKPVANQNVTASGPSYAGGPRALDRIEAQFSDFWRGQVLARGQAQTNSRGEYRITGLPPGQYYLSVGGRTSVIRTAIGVEFLNPGPARTDYEIADYRTSTYFPGTTDPYSASPVDLRAGASANGVDISIAPVWFRRIRGVVIDDSTGGRAASAELLMVPRNAPAHSSYTRSIDANKGSFEINSVLPGAYFIVAFVADQNRTRTGRVSVEVGKDHLENVTVHVGPGFDVTGRVIFEGRETIGNSASTLVLVTLRPKVPSEPGILPEPTRTSLTVDFRNSMTNVSVIDNGPTRSALAVPAVNATADSDGLLNFRSVVPWDYTAEVSTASEDSYVKSIRMGNLDVLNGGISIDGPLSDALEIVMGSNAGILEGRVVDGKSIPVENAKVVLVPAGVPQNRADLFKYAWSNASGTFRMGQIAPGDYILYAWEQVDEGAWQDPAFLRLYEGRGKPVHIRERTRESVETQLIPPWF